MTFGYQDIGLLGQSPGGYGVWGDYRFEINNDVDECDYWVVAEWVPERQSARVPDGNLILLVNEPAYNHASYSPAYLRQFDRVFTCRDDVRGDNVSRAGYITNWWVKRTYDQIKSDRVEKTRKLSVIASDRAVFEGHRKRFALVNRLIGHFKDRLDVYGGVGGRRIDDKYDAIAPYEYSIAIEADRQPGYWTEKIADCFLCETMPVYYGCPDIAAFFDAGSFIAIDVDDYKASIDAIEQAIEENAYSKRRERIIAAKHKVLDQLQIFPHIVSILQSNGNHAGPHKSIEVLPAARVTETTSSGWQHRLIS